ncbi:HetP family heterocyst commitment protein [Desmonostoc muscorum CCALA 125]|uniref:HetP family heterocyst commitment protein n=1 Tax=Desmonostoc muscorum LEGE 12446 TaxID=1828758 RepID=A0A8J6ZU06_DESMC|nr:HetP family heterocyst commitment protein [Desmonostoc muscorum]MBX9256870.1 HetP family heterocyst commitment protein [Desmonostoc muscorum CCALA 125]MCF2149164.1 HetP family heterocyst commitment protein [Desmonostoc muscorum LEGE 12446]
MTQNITGYQTQMGRKINNEQIEQILKAIIAGKYSWACVLILRFAGYNPIDYIPYRTYIRLLKNNCLVENSKLNQSDSKAVEDLNLKSTWLQL